MAAASTEQREARTAERVETVEAKIQASPDNPSPFLAQLKEITGPDTGAAARTLNRLDQDKFLGRAEGLEARQILEATKGSTWQPQWLTDMRYGNSITKQDVAAYAAKDGLSAGERALATRLGQDFDKISGGKPTIDRDDIAKFQAKEKQAADIRNLYAKDSPGRRGESLYEHVKDPKHPGGISGQAIDSWLKDPKILPQDRASLEALNKLRQRDSSGNPTGDVTPGQMLDQRIDARLPKPEAAGLRRFEPRSAEALSGRDALTDLVAKPGGGRSLFDQVKTAEGGVSIDGVNRLLSNNQRLTEQNRKTLTYLQQQGINQDTGMPRDLTRTDLQTLGSAGSINWDQLSSRPPRTSLDPTIARQNQDFAHLFDKAPGQQSLYERFSKDGKLSATGVAEALARPDGLSQADRRTLDYVSRLAPQSWDGVSVSSQGVGLKYKPHDIPAADLMAKAREHNVGDAALRRGGFDIRAAERPVTPAAAPATQTDLPPRAQEALRVKPGEAYWHTANALLREANKQDKRYEPTQKEMKELVTELTRLNGPGAALKVNQKLELELATRERLFARK